MSTQHGLDYNWWPSRCRVSTYVHMNQNHQTTRAIQKWCRFYCTSLGWSMGGAWHSNSTRIAGSYSLHCDLQSHHHVLQWCIESTRPSSIHQSNEERSTWSWNERPLGTYSTLIPQLQVPEGTIILPAVWSMKRKWRILTNEVYKWKARLNVHGGKQIKNVHYWETFSLVVRWSSIWLFLIIAAINRWKTRQFDFVLAFLQADIKTELFTEILKGFKHNASWKTHCLKLKKNLYGQKQAGQYGTSIYTKVFFRSVSNRVW